jgi:hypothetical protein
VARARHDQMVWWYRSGNWAELLSDAAFLAADPAWYADKNVILYGNADTNAAWSRLVPADHPIRARDGSIVAGEQRFEGHGLACLFTCHRADQPQTERKLVGVFGDSDPLGTWLGLAWEPFVSGVNYPDWVVASTDSLLPGGRWLAASE